MALQTFVGLVRFFRFLIYTQSVGLIGRVISPSQGLFLYIGQHKHRINAYTNIHTSSRIRTYDPSVRASEDSSCLRQLGYRDRRSGYIDPRILTSALDIREWSASRPAALPPVPIVLDAGWAPEPVWTTRRGKKSCPYRDSNLITS
jgi:hypothetical protein